jgi:hypothetical protein
MTIEGASDQSAQPNLHQHHGTPEAGHQEFRHLKVFHVIIEGARETSDHNASDA